eukprot:5879011-Pyramimonas_sp.AAC.1
MKSGFSVHVKSVASLPSRPVTSFMFSRIMLYHSTAPSCVRLAWLSMWSNGDPQSPQLPNA